MSTHWNDSQPIYWQLKERTVAMILDGTLGEGEALPSVRTVASEFQLNPINAFNDIFILRPRSNSPLSDRLTYGLMFFKGHDVPEYESAVKIRGTVNEPGDTDEGWTAEIKLPFKSLMMPGQRPGPAVGDIWRIQIAFQTGTDKAHRYHVWAPSFNAWHHHCIDHWGRVLMGD